MNHTSIKSWFAASIIICFHGSAAYDYFGDGSFYLLDSPGHCTGHLSALARTTSSSVEGEDTFIFLGGDICHFAGDFRPSYNKPLPQSLPGGFPNRRKAPIQCPCSLTSYHPNAVSKADAQITPWYKMASKFPTAYHDVEVATSSVLKMQALDQDDNVLVCLAHDAILLDTFPLFNKSPEADMNDWKSKGMKDKCHWGWLNDISIDGKPARDPVVEGFWRDGKLWDYGEFKKTLGLPPRPNI